MQFKSACKYKLVGESGTFSSSSLTCIALSEATVSLPIILGISSLRIPKAKIDHLDLESNRLIDPALVLGVDNVLTHLDNAKAKRSRTSGKDTGRGASASLFNPNKRTEPVGSGVGHIRTNEATSGTTNGNTEGGIGLEVGVVGLLNTGKDGRVDETAKAKAGEEGQSSTAGGEDERGVEAKSSGLERVDERLPNSTRADGGTAEEDAGLSLSGHIDIRRSGNGLLDRHVRRVPDSNADTISNTSDQGKVHVSGVQAPSFGDGRSSLPSKSYIQKNEGTNQINDCMRNLSLLLPSLRDNQTCARLPLMSLTGGEDLGDGNLDGDLNATGKHLTERIGLVGMVLGFIRQLVTGGTLLDLEELHIYKNRGKRRTKGVEKSDE